MMAALPEEQYETMDILIDREGMWHLRGMPVQPARALQQLDVALNALHGGIGEDGTVQRMLTRAGVPFAGSRALSSGLALNKIRTRELLHTADIPMPRGVAFSLDNRMSTRDMGDAVFASFGPPYVIKPPIEGSSHGIRLAQTVRDLPDAIGDVLDAYGSVLVEEYVMGENAVIAVVERFRDEPLYAFPPTHINLPAGVMLYDPLNDTTPVRHVVPSRFSQAVKTRIADMARSAHEVLKLAHYSDADFIVSRRGPVLLEVNTTPPLYGHAPLPRMLEAVGATIKDLLEHLLSLARSRV